MKEKISAIFSDI